MPEIQSPGKLAHAREAVNLFTLHAEREGLVTDVWDVAGNRHPRATVHSTLLQSIPDETLLYRLQQLADACDSGASPVALIRGVAELFAFVHPRSNGTVSEGFEIGTLSRDVFAGLVHRHARVDRATEFAGASDSNITARFRPLGIDARGAGEPIELARGAEGATYKKLLGVSSGLVQTASVANAAITKAKTEARFRCKAYHSAVQSINNATLTVLAFDSEEYDVGNLHDTVTNNSRITIPTGGDVGLWILVAGVYWAANATGARIVQILKNGTTVVARNQIQAVNSALDDTVQQAIATLDSLTVGDYFEVRVLQRSGGALNVGAGTDHVTHLVAHHVW
jgi:hypothetical protein